VTQKFTLQRVLDFKEQLEGLLQIEVAAIEGQRIELQHAVDDMRRQWEETSTVQQNSGPSPIDPTLVGQVVDYLAVLDRRIRGGDETLQQVQQALDAKRGELETAYQERELLERLKQKQAAQELKAEQRRDVRTLEDVSTSMYIRRADEDRRSDQRRRGVS
jgi:flagellar export protein FliJ